VSTVTGQADHPRVRIVHHLKSSVRDVDELAGIDLADPGVEASVAIREKREELAVGRDRRIRFLAGEVGQAVDRGPGKRVAPEIVAFPQLPGAASGDEADGAHDREQQAARAAS
jgi:hypothetical protein